MFCYDHYFLSTISSEWEKEKYSADEKGRTPSLLRAVIRAFGKGYIALGILAIITVSSVCNVCSTLFEPSRNIQLILFSIESLNCKIKPSSYLVVSLSLSITWYFLYGKRDETSDLQSFKLSFKIFNQSFKLQKSVVEKSM